MEREDSGRCAAQDPADNSRACYKEEGMPKILFVWETAWETRS